MLRFVMALTLLAATPAAADAPRAADAPLPASAPAVEVFAKGETAPVATPDDAADDPAIWRNLRAPARSLIVATDKKAGLNVYDLSGRQRSSIAAGRVNNVDLREVRLGGRKTILVGASDRTDRGAGKLALFALDPATAVLTPLARLDADVAVAYGFCFWKRASDQQLFAFVVGKDGAVRQLALDLSGAAPRATIVRRFALQTQSEGCVADDKSEELIVAEEDVGLWRFSATPDGPTTGTMLAAVDGAKLVADLEGVALAREGGELYMIVSSQGDSANAMFRVRDGAFIGRFRIAAGVVGGTSETDGIELVQGDFSRAFKDGLFIAQDGDNAPNPQNFKLVAWRDVKQALGLR
jgi:3-phytase